MTDHEWLYIVDNFFGTTSTVGPIPEAEILKLAKQGKITVDTKVASPTRTNGQWLLISSIPGIVKIIESGQQERQAKKDKEKQQLAIVQANREAQERERQQQGELIRQQTLQQMAQISDCQDPNLLATIRQRVQGILTSNEVVEYIAIQKKPLVNIAPDAMVATNRRLIFYRPKILGRFEFQDYNWFDLQNAHIQQNLLGAVFTARHISGQVLSMDYLTPEGSQALYRLAQTREEQARIARYQMQVDVIRAGSSQINIQNNVPTSAVPPTPEPFTIDATPAKDDLFKRLETLKRMFDAGLITPDDFAARKQEILSQV